MEFPEEFTNRIKQILPSESIELLQALSEQPSVSIRLHPIKGEGLLPENKNQIPWCSSGYYLNERPYFTHDPLFHAGSYYVQEASSMFIEQFLKIKLQDIENPAILDLCAAPGGKSTHILAMLNGKGMLVTNELIANRNAILRENITKWGYSNVVVTQNEAKDFANANAEFDVIIVDAPCSGEGMFRKDKNAINEWSVKNVNQCVIRQKNILSDITACLKPGGLLIYSTCTFEPDENIEQIKALVNSGNFESVNPENLFIEKGITITEKDAASGLSFYPHKVKGEGFFVACVQKKGKWKPYSLFSQKGEKYPGLINKYVDTTKQTVLSHDNQYYFTNSITASFTSDFRRKIRIKKTGLDVGAFKGNDFIPSPDLAFSVNRCKSIRSIDIDLETAIKFLKCENIHFPNQEKGWYLITYQNQGLGWVKILEGRTNNYYPQNWRILK